MCGRFMLTASGQTLAHVFGLAEPPGLEPRPNIAPGQLVAVVQGASDEPRRLALVRWGLVPSWAEQARPRGPHVNARAETAADLPAFRDAFEKRRCLVPADGFYEWRARQPFVIRLKDGRPFAFAGLWEPAPRDGPDRTPTCVLLTTDANPLVAGIHDRMPLIIRPEDYAHWLDPRARRFDLRPLLQAYPAEEMTAAPAPRWVNDPRNQGPPELSLF